MKKAQRSKSFFRAKAMSPPVDALFFKTNVDPCTVAGVNS